MQSRLPPGPGKRPGLGARCNPGYELAVGNAEKQREAAEEEAGKAKHATAESLELHARHSTQPVYCQVFAVSAGCRKRGQRCQVSTLQTGCRSGGSSGQNAGCSQGRRRPCS